MDVLEQLPVGKPTALVGTFAVLSIVYFIGKTIYDLYYGPLSHIPGPKITAFSRIPYARAFLNGSTVECITRLHKQYGEVVRISPNEVSFTSGETAWRDIYGFRTGSLKGHDNMMKDPAWYAPPPNGTPSILLANDEDHARGRRILSHAFSERALAEQEGLVQSYVDQLVTRLKEVTSGNDEPVNMVNWLNWCTFDVISALLFGEPFGSLRDLRTHKYIELLLQSIKAFRLYYIMVYFPWVKQLGSLVVDKSLLAQRVEYAEWVGEQTRKRMAADPAQPDFMTHILNHNGDKPELALTDKEIEANASLFITAGSETTATLLSGATYLLLKNPATYEKLKQEVRSTWKSYDDITLHAVNSDAPYLNATIQESLRYFPPVPAGMQRRVGKGGEVVSGYYIPEHTGISVSQYPTFHSEHNFKNADAFVPERWMDAPEYADDKRSVCQPFSFGPRNCLGKNLANAEMRLILAKLVWSFDFELDPKSAHWMDECSVMTLWVKPELAVRVKEVIRV